VSGAPGVLGDEAPRAETGGFHVSADIGCHTFSTLPPFNIGHTVLGYGLGLASNSGIARCSASARSDHGRRRFLAQRLTSGIANAVFNRDDAILVIMKNGYTSATARRTFPPRCIRASGNRAT